MPHSRLLEFKKPSTLLFRYFETALTFSQNAKHSSIGIITDTVAAARSKQQRITAYCAHLILLTATLGE